jgi:hypothetical protein
MDAYRRMRMSRHHHTFVPVSGPFVTPNDLCLYVVDGCIVTRAELQALYESGLLTVESIAAVLFNLRRLQTA